MDGNNYRVLFVGSASSIHIKWFSEALQKGYPQIKVDIFNRGEKSREDLSGIYNQVFNYKRHHSPLLYKIPIISGKLIRKDVEISFIDFVQSSSKYDVVIFLGVPYWHKKTISAISKIADKSAVFPFGSDLLRCKSKDVDSATNFLREIEAIAAITPVMKDALKNRFKVDDTKIRGFIMGYDFVDRIVDSNLTSDEAKKQLDLEGRYIIACGYNGYPGQRHFKILPEILKIKDKLPSNYILMIPLSYGCNKSYVEKVRKYCVKNGLNHIIFDKFLSNEAQLCTRFATDVFIHAQPTDNGSGSLHEFLLAGAKMVNGEWVRYTQYEVYEVPYFLYDSFDALGSTVLRAIKENNPCTSKTKELLTRTSRKIAIKEWANFIMNK